MGPFHRTAVGPFHRTDVGPFHRGVTSPFTGQLEVLFTRQLWLLFTGQLLEFSGALPEVRCMVSRPGGTRSLSRKNFSGSQKVSRPQAMEVISLFMAEVFIGTLSEVGSP